MSSSILHFKTFRLPLLKTFKLPLLVMLSLLAWEVGIRVHHFSPKAILSWRRYDPATLFSTDLISVYPEKKLGWRLRPNLRTFYKGQPFSTNSHGFRDRERSVVKGPDVHRIAVLGRSYAMGTGVADTETWVSMLEGKFEEQFRSAKEIFGKVEVLNFSVEAYNMNQVELTFHRFAKNFNPSWIILPIFYEEIDTVVPLLAPPISSQVLKLASVGAWLDHLYFPRVLQFLEWNYFLNHGSSDWDYLYNSDPENRKNQRKPRSSESLVQAEPYTTVVQRIINSAWEQGIQVALAPMPRLVRTSDILYSKGKNLVGVYSHGKPWILFMTELEQLQDQISPADTAIPGDPHFGPRVQRLLAEKVFDSFSLAFNRDPKQFWARRL